MNKLLECTRGPWTICPKDDWRIRSALPDKGITVAECWARDCEANAALIAAAYDHALIGWALLSCHWEFRTQSPAGGLLDVTTYDDVRLHIVYIAEYDPFGFPILTDDLRARLIAAMEGAE